MIGGAIARQKAALRYRQARPVECCRKCEHSKALTPGTVAVYRWPLHCQLAGFGVQPHGVCDRFKSKPDEVPHEEL